MPFARLYGADHDQILVTVADEWSDKAVKHMPVIRYTRGVVGNDYTESHVVTYKSFEDARATLQAMTAETARAAFKILDDDATFHDTNGDLNDE